MRLRQARMAKLLTMRELAEKAGVSLSTVHLTETGQTVPRIAVIRKLAGNATARFSETGYSGMVVRAEADDELTEILGMRVDMPPKHLRELLQRATDFRDSHTVTVNSWAEFAEAVKTGWALAFHCGQSECEDDIKAASAAATPRCIPNDGEPEEGTCIRCNAPSAYGKRILFGRAY